MIQYLLFLILISEEVRVFQVVFWQHYDSRFEPLVNVIAPERWRKDHHTRHALCRETVNAVEFRLFELPKLKFLKDAIERISSCLRDNFDGDWWVIQHHVKVQFYQRFDELAELIGRNVVLEIVQMIVF